VLKRDITFEDLDGNTVTDTFYFNLNKLELVEIEAETGGLSEMLMQIVEEKDVSAIVDVFKKIILLAYGERSADGRTFRKNQQIRDDFANTDAFSELFIELATNADKAVEFIRGIVPSNIAVEVNPVQPPTQPLTKVEAEQMSRSELLAALNRLPE
jgi:hypothetical protein